MERINSVNVDPNLHGPGKAGFHGGNYNTGVKATFFTPKWVNHVQEQICQAIESAGIALDGDNYNQLYDAMVFIAESKGFIHLTSGEALPDSNLGPIWHDDYNSLMTWQVFDQNGADYAGYASVLVGSLFMDTQPTARKGYFASGAASLSKTAYAALWNWALHNGRAVALGAWQAGTLAVCDNGNGTFKLFDVRGEGFRAWDAGRGRDASRAFGSFQDSQNKSHAHTMQNAGYHAHSASTDQQGSHSHTAWTDAQGFHNHRVNVGAILGSNQSGFGRAASNYAGGSPATVWEGTDGQGNHGHNVGIGSAGQHSHNVTVNANGDHAHTINADGGSEARSANVAYLASFKF